MSLAMYASPFDSDSSNDVSNTYATANKRRNINNRTQKRQEEPSYSASKVNSVLNAIHNSVVPSSDSSLADFKPLAPPVSVGVENTRINNPDSSNSEDDIDLQNLNSAHMNEQASAQYYKQFMPAYQQPQTQVPSNQPQAPQVHSHMKDNTNVIAKLNYMIHLLEEQKDERTNNVTEEVVLYSFLGIFVIFIVDSFVRVGKYVR
jgi:hypothetical protein